MAKRLYAAIVVLIAIALAIYEFGTVALGDGWYDVSVSVEKSATTNTESIAFLCVNGRQAANEIVESVDQYLPKMETANLPGRFTIQIGHSTRTSPLGRNLGQSQEYSDLVVVLIGSDGKRRVHQLKIPSWDQPSELVVTPESLRRTLE